jgi:hypothetical protein
MRHYRIQKLGAHRHTQQQIQKGGVKMALISIKDLKAAIAVMRQILEKLDEIYHVLHDKQ